jgi:hypothetical protein
MPFTHDKADGSSNLPALSKMGLNKDMWQSGLMHHTWNMTYLGTMSSNLILSDKAVHQSLIYDEVKRF